MHSKQKGSCGELAVALDLTSKGYSVFTELGDLSRTDLIVLVNNKPIKIQVKARYMDERSKTLAVRTTKDGPNYSYKYELSDVDIFAIYSLNTKEILYITAQEMLKCKSAITFRYAEGTYQKDKRARYIKDYLSFEKTLLDLGS